MVIREQQPCPLVFWQRLALNSAAIAGAWALVSCSGGGGGYTPQPPVSPPGAHTLESVPFERIGNGKVVFYRSDVGGSGRDGIYVVDANSRTSAFEFDTSVTGTTAWYPAGPAVSPDGLSIAYTRLTDMTTLFDEYVANLNGSGARQVSSFGGQEGPPTWTPDGHQLVFYASNSLYRQPPIVPIGSERVTIASLSGVITPGVKCESLDNFWTGRVSVSSSGQTVWACAGSSISVTSPDGSTTTAIYAVPTQPAGTFRKIYAPAWSPDDKRIAFLEITGAGVYAFGGVRQSVSVKSIDNQGRNELLLATVPASGAREIGAADNIYSLCWSADGALLVFNVPDGDVQSHLWVMNANGSAPMQITSAIGVWDASVSCSR
jgi:Tol biopolymer transport system component